MRFSVRSCRIAGPCSRRPDNKPNTSHAPYRVDFRPTLPRPPSPFHAPVFNRAAIRDDGIRSGPDDDDEDDRDGVCLSDDDVETLFEDLDSLKERLSLVEEIERALSTIEARVDQLDSKLVGLCDSDMERSLIMQKLLQDREELDEREEEAREGREERARRALARKKASTENESSPPQGAQTTKKAGMFDTEILSHPFHLKKQTPQPKTNLVATEQEQERAREKERETKRLKTERAWENYNGSFTIVLTKGYLQAVDNLRQRMMIQEYDTHLAGIARRNGIARFEAFCAISKEKSVSFSTIEALYENPKDLSVIQDEHLRMRCQSLIRTEEMKMKEKCYLSCTEEARRLAGVFSKTDFLSKVLPDPIEHGLVSSVETLMAWYNATTKSGP